MERSVLILIQSIHLSPGLQKNLRTLDLEWKYGMSAIIQTSDNLSIRNLKNNGYKEKRGREKYGGTGQKTVRQQ